MPDPTPEVRDYSHEAAVQRQIASASRRAFLNRQAEIIGRLRRLADVLDQRSTALAQTADVDNRPGRWSNAALLTVDLVVTETAGLRLADLIRHAAAADAAGAEADALTEQEALAGRLAATVAPLEAAQTAVAEWATPEHVAGPGSLHMAMRRLGDALDPDRHPPPHMDGSAHGSEL